MNIFAHALYVFPVSFYMLLRSKVATHLTLNWRECSDKNKNKKRVLCFWVICVLFSNVSSIKIYHHTMSTSSLLANSLEALHLLRSHNEIDLGQELILKSVNELTVIFHSKSDVIPLEHVRECVARRTNYTFAQPAFLKLLIECRCNNFIVLLLSPQQPFIWMRKLYSEKHREISHSQYSTT